MIYLIKRFSQNQYSQIDNFHFLTNKSEDYISNRQKFLMMKFTEVMENTQQINQLSGVLDSPADNAQNELDQLKTNDNQDEEPNQDIINLTQIYEYSQQNVMITPQIIIRQKFIPQVDTSNNLKESRELQPQSHHISRSLLSSVSKLNPDWLLAERSKRIQASSTTPITPQKISQKKRNQKNIQKSLTFEKNDSEEKRRVSIFSEHDKQMISNLSLKSNGLVRLKSNTRRQTLAIKTYRKVRNRLQSMSNDKQKQQKVKKKIEVKKDQNSRFKTSAISYDYDGKPLPLKYCKKIQINNMTAKTSQSITMIPMPDNIIRLSAGNQNFSNNNNRKPLFIQKDFEQQHRDSQFEDQQFVVCQKSQFLRRIPKHIQTSQLFHKKNDNQKFRKTLDQATFSQFKYHVRNQKNLTHFEAQHQQSKILITEMKDTHENKNVSRKLKKTNLSQGKVTTVQKIFEKVFQFKPTVCKDNLIEDRNNQFSTLQKTDKHKQKFPSKTFYKHENIPTQQSSRKSSKRQMDHLNINYDYKLQKSQQNKKQPSQSFFNNKKASTSRFNFNISPQKVSRYSQSIHDKNMNENIFSQNQRAQQQSKYVKIYQYNNSNINNIRNSSILSGQFQKNKNRQKLKTKPSLKYVDRAW